MWYVCTETVMFASPAWYWLSSQGVGGDAWTWVQDSMPWVCGHVWNNLTYVCCLRRQSLLIFLPKSLEKMGGVVHSTLVQNMYKFMINVGEYLKFNGCAATRRTEWYAWRQACKLSRSASRRNRHNATLVFEWSVTCHLNSEADFLTQYPWFTDN